jgi:TolB protein
MRSVGLVGATAGLVLVAGLAASLGQPPETRTDGATRLTSPSGQASDQNPAFSPDGKRLVFTRFEKGYNAGPASLFLLDLASGRLTRLTPAEDQDNVNNPGAAWSAVSDRIVFASDRSGGTELWRIASDSTDFSRITSHIGSLKYQEPSWSPDGQWIVFEVIESAIGSIWKVRANGASLTRLTGSSFVDDRQPNWSSAGRILFQRRTLPAGEWDIYSVAPDGTDLKNVTNNAGENTDASWSSDGRFIVYSSNFGRLPTANIFIIPAAGGPPTRVTRSSATEDGAPSWSPDGKWIAFESHPSANAPSSLWLVPVAKTRRRSVAS